MNIFAKIKLILMARRTKSRGIFYINGPDVLPPPLSHEEEAEILSRIGEDENARPLLVEHNLRLVVYIAKRFENTGIGIEDLVSIGTIGLIKAISRWCGGGRHCQCRRSGDPCIRPGA